MKPATGTEKDRKADRKDHQFISDDSITQVQLGSAETQLGTFIVQTQETEPSQPCFGEEGDIAEDREQGWGRGSPLRCREKRGLELGLGQDGLCGPRSRLKAGLEMKIRSVVRLLTFEDQGAQVQQTPRNLG